jgi:hypothetical protein
VLAHGVRHRDVATGNCHIHRRPPETGPRAARNWNSPLASCQMGFSL